MKGFLSFAPQETCVCERSNEVPMFGHIGILATEVHTWKAMFVRMDLLEHSVMRGVLALDGEKFIELEGRKQEIQIHELANLEVLKCLQHQTMSAYSQPYASGRSFGAIWRY